VAMHATSLAPACEVVAPLSLDDSSAEHSLSMQLAQAYGDLRDAQESTSRARSRACVFDAALLLCLVLS